MRDLTTDLKEIFLNRDNVNDWQHDTSWSNQECLNHHMELNEALDGALGGRTDWGGRYASWLNNIGVSHQTDAGWWNETAVCRENLLCFVQYWSEEEESEMQAAYAKRKEDIARLPKDCRVVMKAHYVNIRELLED